MKSVLCTALLAATMTLGGCASISYNSDANLRMASAAQIGQNYTSDDITVSDVVRGATRVSWTAKTPKGVMYQCEADDMVRRPNCVKQRRR